MSIPGARGRAMLATVTAAAALAALSGAQAVAVSPAPIVTPPIGPVSPAPVPVPRLAYVVGTARSPSQVWLATASGAERKRLGPGEQPLLAPNGQMVAAGLFGATANSEKGPAIALYSAVGAPVANYLDLETATSTPLAWSPDSRYLAVARESNETTDIAAGSGVDVIDTQTGTVTSIAEGQIAGASFAQDGSDRIVFALAHSLSPSAATNLYISNPDGTGLQRVTSDGRSLNPVWGPRYIAFDKERLRRGDAPVYQIWLRAPAAATARKLTNLKVRSLVAGLVPLAFSATGSRLVAEFEGQDTSEAWTVAVSSGRARRLSVRRRSVQAAGISSDGHTVLVDVGSFEEPPSRGSVATLPFGGGRAKVLVAHGAEGSWNR
jgi:hypothetical protein